jgi:hypothetical protein
MSVEYQVVITGNETVTIVESRRAIKNPVDTEINPRMVLTRD